MNEQTQKILGLEREDLYLNRSYFCKEEIVQVPLYLPAPPPPTYDSRKPEKIESEIERSGTVIIIDPNEDENDGVIVINL